MAGHATGHEPFGLGDQIHALFEGIGGDFESPARRQDLPRASEFMT